MPRLTKLRKHVLENYKCADCQQPFKEIELLAGNYKIEKLIKDCQAGADIIKSVNHKRHEAITETLIHEEAYAELSKNN